MIIGLGVHAVMPCFLLAQSEEIPVSLQPINDAHRIANQDAVLKLMSAKSAVEFGFASIATPLFEQLLEESEALDAEVVEEARYHLVLSLLNQGNVSRARSHLDPELIGDSPRLALADLLLAYAEQVPTDELEQRLSTLAGVDFGADQVWLPVMRAVIAIRRGNLEQGRRIVDGALAEAATTFQRSWIELLIWREEIQSGEANESLLISLRSQIENAVNPLIASQLTQQYAIVLHALGRDSDAIRMIEQQLPLLGDANRDQRDRMLMLLAIISGRQSGRTQVAIDEILLNGRSERIRSMAFYHWLATLEFSDPSIRQTLQQLRDSRPNDPLRHEIAYALALSHFYSGNLNQSQVWTDSILESDASASLKMSALRVLIAVCWSQNPPQYRLAAEHLLRLRRLTQVDADRFRQTLLIADSYYLNGDFENAIPYYRGLLDENLSPRMRNELLYKITDSMLKLGNVDGARPILDRFHDEQPALSELIWGSEWNFNLHLVKVDRLDEAIVRMEQLRDRIQSVAGEGWSQMARLRVGWLLGFLNFQKQDYAEANRAIELALNSYESLPVQTREPLSVLGDELMLLSARCHFADEQSEAAEALIEQIRERGNSTTSAASYIVEARFHLSQGENLEAQRALTELADRYPDSEYAPVALYEAAISMEMRLSENSDQEAITLYDRISTQFPDHPLNFIAKLRQGDLLRKSNQFALAISFYENVLQDYRDDPRLYLVEMAMGESYLAMGSTRADYTDQASRIFERIFDRTHLPIELRIEAGAKAATALEKVGRGFRAQDILWRVVSLVTLDSGSSQNMGASGKYWLSRALLQLADYLIANDAAHELDRLTELADSLRIPGANLIRNKL